MVIKSPKRMILARSEEVQFKCDLTPVDLVDSYYRSPKQQATGLVLGDDAGKAISFVDDLDKIWYPVL